MKVELYNQMVRSGLTRRGVLKGAAATGGLAAMGGFIPGMAAAEAHGNVRAAILAIPGVGAGSPSCSFTRTSARASTSTANTVFTPSWVRLTPRHSCPAAIW